MRGSRPVGQQGAGHLRPEGRTRALAPTPRPGTREEGGQGRQDVAGGHHQRVRAQGHQLLAPPVPRAAPPEEGDLGAHIHRVHARRGGLDDGRGVQPAPGDDDQALRVLGHDQIHDPPQVQARWLRVALHVLR
jgi:hypothetical protein